MAKSAKADIPAVYPLKRDHKKPEKSKIGIIVVKDNQKQYQGQNQADLPNLDVQIQPDDQIMADIDNVNKPDRIERPKVQHIPCTSIYNRCG